MLGRSLARKTYDFFLKYWALTTFFLSLGASWMIVLRIIGRGNYLVTPTGDLTPTGFWITLSVFLLSTGFAFLKSLADKHNEKLKHNGYFVLDRMLECANSITHKKLNRIKRFIKANVGKTDIDSLRKVTEPQEQIENILENIQTSLAEIADLRRGDIGISVIYKFESIQNWRYLHLLNADNELEIDELVSNPKTSVYQLVQNGMSQVFFPDKRDGIDAQKYHPSRRDQQYENRGSILCRSISMPEFVEAIICISTYGSQLCHANDEETKGKISRILMPMFETRIQLELALLYIREIMDR